MADYKILLGNCKETLKTLEDESVDSIVTDPPYELGFIGTKWDSQAIAYDVEMWQECLRVLKPGGTVLDPFMGSGTTGVAAINQGFNFVGCELMEEYIPIAEGRIEHALNARK